MLVIAEDLRAGSTSTRAVLHFVLTEGVLRWHVDSPQIMIGQAEHLATLVELPNVRLGIMLITDVRDVADFAARFEIYAGFADYGDAARAGFKRIAVELSVLLCSALFRAAGQEWLECGDIWHRMARLRAGQGRSNWA